MATIRSTYRALALAAAATAIVAAPVALEFTQSAPSSLGAPCVNGVVPLNPNVINCALPQRAQRIPGQAPDAGALIACKGSPQCLSYFVNYPGQTVWDSGLWSPGNQ